MKLLIKLQPKNRAKVKFSVFWEAVSPLFLWYKFLCFCLLNLIRTEIIKSKKLYILEDCEKDCHLKSDTAIFDSFEIFCIEETSLHAYLNTFYQKQASSTCGNFFCKYRISRIFTRIISKENMQNTRSLKLWQFPAKSAVYLKKQKLQNLYWI